MMGALGLRVIGEGDLEHDPVQRRRCSIRLKAFDYSSPGAYFVTLCTHDRGSLFGDLVDGEMRLNDFGRVVQAAWDDLPRHYPNVKLDACVVMPNHVHGIIVLTRPEIPDGSVGAIYELPLHTADAEPPQHLPIDIRERRRMLLPRIVGRFKMTTAKAVNLARGTPGTPVWQRNYFEYVIRHAESLSRTRAYILGNPARWTTDRYNPQADARTR